jgi:hypothetical protein
MERPLIYRIACALDPLRPIAWLATIGDVSYSTAKTWAYGGKHWAWGNRPAPPTVLRQMHAALETTLWATPTHEAQRPFLELLSLLDGHIWDTERRPLKPRGLGFMQFRERDGPGTTPRDGRNRKGRPKRNTPSAR